MQDRRAAPIPIRAEPALRADVGPGFFAVIVAAICVAWLQLGIPVYGDLYWQIPEGVQILGGHLPTTIPYAIDAGPWLDHEWLFEAFAALAWTHHAYPVFAIVCDLAYAFFPAFLYATLRRERGDLAAGVVALLAAAAIFFTNPYRPQTFAYYFFTIAIVEFRNRRPNYWLLFATTALWANVHASVIAAPAFGLLFATGAAIETGWRSARTRTLAACAGTAALATLVTPHGIGLWSYAFGLVSGAPFTQYIREWRALSFADPVAWPVAACIGILVVSGVPLERRNASALLVSFAAFALCAEHVRQAAFLVPTIGWLLCERLESVIARCIPAAQLAQAGSSRRLGGAPLVAAAAVLALGGAASRLGQITPDVPGPAADAAWLAEHHHIAGNAFVSRPWAAYLPFRGDRVRLLIDSHADPYDAAVWRDVHALETLEPTYRDVLRRRDLHGVVIERTSALASALGREPGWRYAGSRGTMAAFVRE